MQSIVKGRTLFILTLAGIFALSAINSCTSRSNEKSRPAKEAQNGIDLKSAGISGFKVTLGDRATEVYSRIGTGTNTSVKNDPSNQANLIMQHDYASDGGKYRLNFCKTPDRPYYHLCRITSWKASVKNHTPSQPVHKSREEPRLFTDQDLQKMQSKNRN